MNSADRMVAAFNAVGPLVVSESDGMEPFIKEAVRIENAWRREDLGLPLDEGDFVRVQKRK